MENARRHPNVINLAEVPAEEFAGGTRFKGLHKDLTENTGASGLGAGWTEVPPGKTALPCHYHCANEEAAFVLEGRGTLRVGEKSVEIGPGDWITFPVGPAFAHQILNTGTTPLRYLAFSTRLNVDVIGYPDSKKVMAWATPAGVKRDRESLWHRLIVEEKSGVEYFFGEKVD